MYSKIIQKIPRHLASSVSDTSKISDIQQNARHMAYMWGHDTLEDKAARKKKIEDSKVNLILRFLDTTFINLRTCKNMDLKLRDNVYCTFFRLSDGRILNQTLN